MSSLLNQRLVRRDRQHAGIDGRGVKAFRQIVDLIGREDDIPFEESESVFDLGAAVIDARARALTVIDDDFATLAFAHMRAELHRLIEGQPIRRG